MPCCRTGLFLFLLDLQAIPLGISYSFGLSCIWIELPLCVCENLRKSTNNYVEHLVRATNIDESRKSFESKRKSTNIHELIITFAKVDGSPYSNAEACEMTFSIYLALYFTATNSSVLLEHTRAMARELLLTAKSLRMTSLNIGSFTARHNRHCKLYGSSTIDCKVFRMLFSFHTHLKER